MLDIPDVGDDEHGLGGFIEEISPRADRNVRVGFATASSSDHRVSGIAQDTEGISRTASFAGLEPSGEDGEDSASLVSPVTMRRNPGDGPMSPISSDGGDESHHHADNPFR